jgi:bifunctional oligoribonuclease and PAP phosphatase NrnA
MNIYQEIVREITNANHIVITAHKSPDGDSIGSSLGLYHFIRKLGKTVYVCHPDEAGEYLHWVDGWDAILTLTEQEELVKGHLEQSDLIFCLDYNATNRVGSDMQPLLEASSATKIMIDHHLEPEDFTKFSISDTSSCSTAQLVADLIEKSGNLALLDAQIGTPLYLGILTDSGSFRFPSVQPRTHEVLALLLAAGVEHSKVHEMIYDMNSLRRLRIQGYVLHDKLEVIGNYSLMSMTAKELDDHHYEKGDTEGLVNIALSIKGMKAAVFCSEKDGAIKISFRSKGTENAVNKLASDHFEGGGHANAAGGISYLSMDETLDKLRQLLPNYIQGGI